jgi:hypothetical protein
MLVVAIVIAFSLMRPVFSCTAELRDKNEY